MDNKKSQSSKQKMTENSQSVQPKVTIKQKKDKKSAVAIIALSILLGLSLAFGVTAAFFSVNKTAAGNITLGDPVDINITQGGAAVTTLTFTGTAMPGTVYDQVIRVSVPANSSDCVVRGKLTITNTDGAAVNVNATTDANWTLGEDNYYYYKGILSAAGTAGFVTQVTVPTTLTNVDANKTYALSVQIEAI